jgi:hypothetical protein
MLGALKPDLQGVPGRKVRCGLACFFCQRRHDRPGLLLSVGDGKAKQTGLVLGVELDSRGGHDEACWSFPLDQARLDALCGLLDRFISHTSLGEQ